MKVKNIISLYLKEFLVLLLLVFSISIGSANTSPVNDKLTWCGQTWGVDNMKAGNGNPTDWSSSGNNVWVDDNNMLHLKITKNNEEWNQCHLYSSPANQFKYGTFQVTFNSPVLTLDPSVISTMFIDNDWFQPANDKYGDEMDIEFSGWGDFNPWYRGHYSIVPASTPGNCFHDFMSPSSYDGTGMTCVIDWEPDHVTFKSIKSDGTVLNSFTYTNISGIPTNYADIMLQLWLYNNKPPADGKDVEIVLSNFKYTPYGSDSNPNPVVGTDSTNGAYVWTLPHFKGVV